MAAGHISMKFNLKGPTHAPTTACTTGAHSIISASHLIALGHANVVLAGASESCIHPLAIAGFSRAKSLSTSYNNHPHLSSRPFDKNRDGFVIGEGAGVLVLEELNHALTRHPRPKILAELTGSGSSSDAHHITAPHPTGHGAYTSMRLALKNPLSTTSIPPSEVSYVNAHATSTPLGDSIENTAVKNLLLRSPRNPHGHLRPEAIIMSSTKGATGHLLGAAGALEAIFTVLAVRDNVVPPTLNLYNVSSEEEFNCNYVPHTAQERQVHVALSNSFGFGGTNATLCFREYRP
ncbi:MAG: Mitochondrial beta-keto-acyl synthase [Geoglossum simile]|nr:MAG: Mitochondrial beta-keto-acyl synthase [Geoglossum simile]